MIHTLLAFQLRRQLRGAVMMAAFFALLCAGAVLLYDEVTIEAIAEARARNPALAGMLAIGGSGNLVTHLASLVFGFVFPLWGSLYALRLGVRLTAGKIETGEVDYYLALPMHRLGFVLLQALLLLICVGIAVLGALLGGIIASALAVPGQLQAAWFGWLHVKLLVMIFLFGSLGLMLGLGAQQARQANIAGTAITLMLFMAAMLSMVPGAPTWLVYVSIYQLYAPGQPLVGGAMYGVAPLVGFCLLFVFIGGRRFLARDLD